MFATGHGAGVLPLPLLQARKQRIDLLQRDPQLAVGAGIGTQAQVRDDAQGAEHPPALGRLRNASAHDAISAGVQQALAVEAQVPAAGFSNPLMVRIKVVLPASLAPTSATASPALTCIEMPLGASIWP